jgi:hypothetical protein
MGVRNAYQPSTVRGLPGWRAYAGTNVLGNLFWDYPLANLNKVAGMWIWDAGYAGWPAIHGNWCVFLRGGLPWPGRSGPPSAVSIAQNGSVSSVAKSLHYRASAPISVTFAGQPLSPVTSVGAEEFAVDLSRVAGKSGELRFTSSVEAFLDNIYFSAEPVLKTRPELSVLKPGLFGVQLSFSAQIGVDYALQAATNLSNWETILSVRATTSSVEFFDSEWAKSSTKFYRVIAQ